MEVKIFKDLLSAYQDFTYLAQKALGKKSTVTAFHNFDLDNYLKIYSAIDNYFYFVADSVNLKIIRIGGGVKSLTGYEASDFLGKGYSSILKVHNLTELIKITRGGIRFFDYFYSQEHKVRPYIKAIYTFELKKKGGSSFQAMTQSIPILFNDEMEPLCFLNIVTDISEIKSDKTLRHYILDTSDEENIKKIPITVTELSNEQESLVSPSEKKVLLLMADGKNSKQIADELCLSIHTVHTHRKNMLQKLQCSSSGELIKKCLLKGCI